MTYHNYFTILSVSMLLFSCSDNQQKETTQENINVEENTEKKFDGSLEKVTTDWETATNEFKNTVYNMYNDEIEIYDEDGNEVIKTVEFPVSKEKKAVLLKIMKNTLAQNKLEIAKFKNTVTQKDLEDEIIQTVMNENTLEKCERFIAQFEKLSVKDKKNQQQMLVMINGLYVQDSIMNPRDLSALIHNFLIPKIEDL